MSSDAPTLHVRVSPVPSYELRDVKVYCERAGMIIAPTSGNVVVGMIPADRLGELKASPGVANVEEILK